MRWVEGAAFSGRLRGNRKVVKGAALYPTSPAPASHSPGFYSSFLATVPFMAFVCPLALAKWDLYRLSQAHPACLTTITTTFPSKHLPLHPFLHSPFAKSGLAKSLESEQNLEEEVGGLKHQGLLQDISRSCRRKGNIQKPQVELKLCSQLPQFLYIPFPTTHTSIPQPSNPSQLYVVVLGGLRKQRRKWTVWLVLVPFVRTLFPYYAIFPAYNPFMELNNHAERACATVFPGLYYFRVQVVKGTVECSPTLKKTTHSMCKSGRKIYKLPRFRELFAGAPNIIYHIYFWSSTVQEGLTVHDFFSYLNDHILLD